MDVAYKVYVIYIVFVACMVCVAGPGVSANSALGTAQGLASKAPPLVYLPHWVRMPSNAAQHWLRYTFVTAFSAWAGIFLYRSHPFSLLTSSCTAYIPSRCQHPPVQATSHLPVDSVPSLHHMLQQLGLLT